MLVVIDTEKQSIGEAILTAGLGLRLDSVIRVMKPRSRGWEEPPKPIASAWQHANAFLAPTKYSLTHTQARKAATDKGARGRNYAQHNRGDVSENSVNRLQGDRETGLRLLERSRDAREIRALSPRVLI